MKAKSHRRSACRIRFATASRQAARCAAAKAEPFNGKLGELVKDRLYPRLQLIATAEEQRVEIARFSEDVFTTHDKSLRLTLGFTTKHGERRGA